MNNKTQISAYGVVFRGKYKGKNVAIKRILKEPHEWSSKDLQSFYSEMAIMSKVGHHPNVVSLHGMERERKREREGGRERKRERERKKERKRKRKRERKKYREKNEIIHKQNSFIFRCLS